MLMLRRRHGFVLLLVLLFVSGCVRTPSEPRESMALQPPVVHPLDSPAGPDSREPNLFATDDGRVILSWVEKGSENRYRLRFVVRTSKVWSDARTVAEGANWFINWADFPSVISLNDGSFAAHWLVKSGAGTYAYDVNVARAEDGGDWSKPIVPHADKTQTEHGFVSLLPLTDGRIGAIWLDGRNFSNTQHGEGDHGAAKANMTLRYAAIDRSGTVSDEAVLDERVCECCQTAATMTETGAVVVYRDRSPDEVRDIYVVRYQAGQWSSPQPVHVDGWKIDGCPVNGPSISAYGRQVAVAWYTEAGNNPRVNVAFSKDAGASFGPPHQIDDGDAVGRVGVAMLPDGGVYVCWLSGTVESGAIKVRRVTADGTLGPVAIVATSDISRSSGFPRLARMGDEILFAWTEFGKPSYVRTAIAGLN